MFRPYNPLITIVVFVVAFLVLALIYNSVTSKSEYVIPGTVSATCGPTLPQYTYCE